MNFKVLLKFKNIVFKEAVAIGGCSGNNSFVPSLCVSVAAVRIENGGTYRAPIAMFGGWHLLLAGLVLYFFVSFGVLDNDEVL